MADEIGREAPKGAHGQEEEEEVGHVPVLLQEAIDFLAVKAGGTYIDCTVGLGGHSLAIASRLGPRGRLIGFDKDPKALEVTRKRLEKLQDGPQVELVHASFAEIAEQVGEGKADGVLADLGVSSMQLDDAARGFSFQAEAPLDMRMNPQAELTAEQVVNRAGEKELADLIYEFGEERRSRRIARAIVRSRPIRSTKHLAEIVAAAARSMNPSERIHPATRTFQALRIYVNRELEDVKTLLEQAPRVLKSGSRLVVISFHSLEDRLVKDAMRAGAQAGTYKVLTRKPVTASDEEVDRNPRSRSAKLRAAERQ